MAASSFKPCANCSKNCYPGSNYCSKWCRDQCHQAPATPKISGAGFLLTMSYWRQGKVVEVVVLVRERKFARWTLPGGYLQKGKGVFGSACSELWEEACIESKFLKSATYPEIDSADNNGTIYRTFVTEMESGFSRKDFYSEMSKRAANPHTPHDMLETDMLTFVSVSALKSAMASNSTNHKVYVDDIDGNTIGPLRPISAKIIRKAVSQGLI